MSYVSFWGILVLPVMTMNCVDRCESSASTCDVAMHALCCVLHTQNQTAANSISAGYRDLTESQRDHCILRKLWKCEPVICSIELLL